MKDNTRKGWELFRYLLFMFLCIGFLGWCMEFVFRWIYNGQMTIPGFLTGPFCSIYGLAAIFFALVCSGKNMFWVYIKSALAVTVLEFVVYNAFFYGFGVALWDYTDIPLHYGASVCLPFSLIWGFFGILFNRVLEPGINKIYTKHSKVYDKIGIVAVCLLIVDLVITILHLYDVINWW